MKIKTLSLSLSDLFNYFKNLFQAERIMEALELYREESKKLEAHKAACEVAGKEVWKIIHSNRAWECKVMQW